MIELLLRKANEARISGHYAIAERALADASRRMKQAPLSSCLEIAKLYSLMASLRLEQFRPAEAERLLAKARRIAEGHRDAAFLAGVVHKQGIALVDLEHYGQAVDFLLEAKRLYRETGSGVGDVLAMTETCKALADGGQPDLALHYHLRIEQTATELLSGRALRYYGWVRGVIALRAGLSASALAVFDEVVASATEDGDTVAVANSLLDLAEARAGVGDAGGVEEAASQLVALFAALGVKPCVSAAAELLLRAARCRLTALAECVALVRRSRRRNRG